MLCWTSSGVSFYSSYLRDTIFYSEASRPRLHLPRDEESKCSRVKGDPRELMAGVVWLMAKKNGKKRQMVWANFITRVTAWQCYHITKYILSVTKLVREKKWRCDVKARFYSMPHQSIDLFDLNLSAPQLILGWESFQKAICSVGNLSVLACRGQAV